MRAKSRIRIDMKLRGLQHLIERYLAHKGWYTKGALTADIEWKRQTGREYGKRYLPETVGRALRLLEEKSVIAVRGEGVSVAYKWLPEEYRRHYIPYSRRPAYEKHILFTKESRIRTQV